MAGGESLGVLPATSSDSDFNTMIKKKQSCISSNASSRKYNYESCEDTKKDARTSAKSGPGALLNVTDLVLP